ncbi:MAG: hypothetical protein EAX86_02185 [Candidatus Heimdallarchaeota archaeon]|nr:hypothetical protein [Candidatus Heimdallarchaeota archaeon]
MDLSILAVQWDEVSGPQIISIYPNSSLEDPESVALQIYLASVTVFGQHGHTQRTEFTVPLLSLGNTTVARVAFDSWEDHSLRGKERVFFIAFISDQETSYLINTHLNMYIYEYLNILKERKSNFKTEDIWYKIASKSSREPEKIETKSISMDVGEDYAISQALRDLEVAKQAWTELKDRQQLWTALKIANRLETIDDNSSAEAFMLVGNIFLASGNFHDGKEAFEKAADLFAQVRQLEKAGESSFLAGKAASYLKEFDKAIELMQAGSLWLTNPKTQIILNYEIATAYHEQNKREEANSYFEKAIKLAKSSDISLAAKVSAIYSSKLSSQADQEKNENPALALGLLRKAAEQRITTADLLQKIPGREKDTARSLILAANAYFSLGNSEKALSLLLTAINIFIDVNENILAAKTLFDTAKNSDSPNVSLKLFNKILEILYKQESSEQSSALLGLTLFERGKLENKNNAIRAALSSFEDALKYLRKGKFSPSEMVFVNVEYANNLFQIEQYEKAAYAFLEAAKGLENDLKNQKAQEQQEKIIINAGISFRRASTMYHHAGIVAFNENEESKSLDYFMRAASFLLDWTELNPKINDKEREKTIQDRIKSLRQKEGEFVSAEAKYKIKSLIESLNLTLNPMED